MPNCLCLSRFWWAQIFCSTDMLRSHSFASFLTPHSPSPHFLLPTSLSSLQNVLMIFIAVRGQKNKKKTQCSAFQASCVSPVRPDNRPLVDHFPGTAWLHDVLRCVADVRRRRAGSCSSVDGRRCCCVCVTLSKAADAPLQCSRPPTRLTRVSVPQDLKQPSNSAPW